MQEEQTANGVLAIFQNPELPSGAVAMPASPIPPLRASGEIRKNGTAEVTTLMGSALFWAWVAVIEPPSNITKAVSFKVACFMRLYCLG